MDPAVSQCEVAHTTADFLSRKWADQSGAAMENNRAIDQTKLENLSYEFSDEALEIAARGGKKVAGNITLYYCTALYFCPGP